MKLARIHGPGDVRLDEVDEPELGPDDAILEVGACGICGSDVGYARIGGVMAQAPAPMPITTARLFSGPASGVCLC